MKSTIRATYLACLTVLGFIAINSVGVTAEEPAKTVKMRSTKMPDLPRIAYRSFWPQERYNRQFADAGIKLVFIYPSNTICSLDVPYSNYPQIWTGPNQYNWKSLDDHIGDVLKWNPRAKLMVMIDLNTPKWWRESHDDADSYRRLGETLLRDDFRHDTKHFLHKFLEHTESKYKDKIVAYHLACGAYTEWFDLAKGQPGPLKHAAFAKAMMRPGLKVPEDRDKTTHPLFYDPVKDADKIAYWRMHHKSVADAILDYAAEAKGIVGDRAPIGLFFGYIMTHGKHKLLYYGHLDYDRVYQSPLINSISGPGVYQHRGGGGTSGFQFCPDAVLTHGNVAWHEIDHRTHALKNSTKDVVRRMTHDGKRLDFQSSTITTACLRREFSLAMISGMHLWWFDMFGGWFDAPGVMADIKHMTRLAEQFADTGPGRSEVAMLVDADSMYYVNGRTPLADIVIRKLQFALFKTGVPWRCYSLADLPKLDMSTIKVVILPNLFALTPVKRKWLDEKVLRENKHVVTAFAPGIITNDKYDVANIEKLTGVPLQRLSKPGEPQQTIYHACDGWTSVFLTRPQMSSKLLRDIFRKAGVHVYNNDGEPFYVNDELMALHTAKGGPRTFHLPHSYRVVELFEDRVVSPKAVSTFTDDFPPMTTRLYHLIPTP